MDTIIEKENLQITEDTKDYLIHISNYSLRVLINYLEKISIFGEPVDKEMCVRLCCTIPYRSFETYIEQLKSGHLVLAIQTLYDIHDKGYSVIDILDYFYNFIKTTDTLPEETKYRIIPFLCKYITIFNKIHENNIELAFFTNNIYENVFSLGSQEII
jgi:DNA polymerase III gamma/tau subunit